jgi:hypothetical protein
LSFAKVNGVERDVDLGDERQKAVEQRIGGPLDEVLFRFRHRTEEVITFADFSKQPAGTSGGSCKSPSMMPTAAQEVKASPAQ